MQDNQNDVLAYDKQTAAKKLGMAPNTVTKLLETGELRGRKIGQRWVISRRALDEFLGDAQQDSARGRTSAA